MKSGWYPGSGRAGSSICEEAAVRTDKGNAGRPVSTAHNPGKTPGYVLA